MRTPAIVAVLAVAVGLGLLTGGFVLPPRSAPAGTPGVALSSPGHGSPTPTPAGGPLTNRSLVTAADLKEAGYTRRVTVRDSVGDGAYATAACTGETSLGETLGEQNAHIRGLLASGDGHSGDPTSAANSQAEVTHEVAAAAGSPALAQNFAQRLLLEDQGCQDEPATHWVYGPTHMVDVAPGITAGWMGTYQGDLNTTGKAPRDKEPCGGIAVLRNGSHYGVLEVETCLGTAAMNRLVRTAVSRL